MAAEPNPKRQRAIRLGLSLLIVAHLAAVFVPPMAFQARGGLGLSPLVQTIFRPIEAYCQFLYLDRGYAFFAPDPGPSHLIQAAVDSDSGPVEQMYPDRDDQWPRLLYHRHFMITEYLEQIYELPGPPEEFRQVEPEAAEDWARGRARYEHVRQSIVDHLRHVNPGRDVAIRRIEHLLPNLVDYRRDPIPLTDERLYVELLDEPVDVGLPEELAVPSGPPESIAPPAGEVTTP